MATEGINNVRSDLLRYMAETEYGLMEGYYDMAAAYERLTIWLTRYVGLEWAK